MSNAGRGNPACPYLGLEDDAETSLAFPSGWNTCRRGRRAVSPSLEYQSEYCLGENHQKCAVFLAEQSTLPLQHHLRADRSRTRKPRRRSYLSLTFIFIGIPVLIGLGWFFFSPSQILSTATEVPLRTSTASMTPAATHTPAFTHTPTLALTVTPVPVSNGTSSRQLDQPIGSDYKFVIHKVLYGENLAQYASWHNTSVEAIMAVNYDLKTPVWVDALVIIPVEFTNVYGLPAFEAYEVPRADMSLKVLALSFGVSLKDLRYYNAIDMDETLQAGDWLLIPRPRLVP